MGLVDIGHRMARREGRWGRRGGGGRSATWSGIGWWGGRWSGNDRSRLNRFSYRGIRTREGMTLVSGNGTVKSQGGTGTHLSNYEFTIDGDGKRIVECGSLINLKCSLAVYP